jgi:hypothetical protein
VLLREWEYHLYPGLYCLQSNHLIASEYKLQIFCRLINFSLVNFSDDLWMVEFGVGALLHLH